MRERFQRPVAGSLAFSIAFHVALVMALGTIAWRYPLGQLMGIRATKPQPERLQYIVLPAQPAERSVGGAAAAARSAPAALRAPVSTPSSVPASARPDTGREQAAGGTGSGLGSSVSGVATGVMPRQPDPRIALVTGPLARVPRTPSEAVDSIVELAIGIYNDSMAVYGRKNQPVEWIRKTKGGGEWGLTRDYLALGKFKIPTALLALTPLNAQGAVGPIEARSLAYIRRDIMENGQRSISEDEFRTAVKRIRERKEREKRQKQLASEKE